MNRKIPPEAFSYYVGLGAARSYEAVAQNYNCTKRAIVDAAARERWQDRLSVIEASARDSTDKRAVESLEQMTERHLATMRLVQRKALDTLRSTSIGSAMDAVRALRMAVEQERLIRGEPTERSAASIEELIRREYEMCMIPPLPRKDRDDSEEEESESVPPGRRRKPLGFDQS